jgi:polygalacturonase
MKRQTYTRRSVIRALGAGVALGLVGPRALLSNTPAAGGGWDEAARILRRVKPPSFPARDFDVTRHGARGDGARDSRPAINEAINACRRAGGGRVVVPAGVYVSNGPLRLRSNVNLHLSEGATIRFGTNPADYLPHVLVRWEGTRCFNYSPLVYAYRERNLALTGAGALDGRAADFWHEWKRKQEPDKATLRGMGARVSPINERVFGANHFLRPDLFQPYECENLLVEGLTVRGSPFWTIHPVFCTNVTVRRLNVLPGTTNDDGVDPESCRDVLVEDCTFETEDDHVAVKAGRDQDAWGGRPCENVVVRNCVGVRTAANGFCVGSEMSGDVRNVFFENCKVGDAQAAVYVKSNTDRGGRVENVRVRNVEVESCDDCVKLETDYKGVDGAPYPATYRDFYFEGVRCRTARKRGIYSVGIKSNPIVGVTLKDVTVERAAVARQVRFTEGLRLENVRVNGERLDPTAGRGAEALPDG